MKHVIWILLCMALGWFLYDLFPKNKKQESLYEWVEVSHPDTVYFNGGYFTIMQSFVRKHKNETIEQCLDRMDSTYGRSPFRVKYVNRLADIEISGEAPDSSFHNEFGGIIDTSFNSNGESHLIRDTLFKKISKKKNKIKLRNVDSGITGTAAFALELNSSGVFTDDDMRLYAPLGVVKLGGALQSNTIIDSSTFRRFGFIIANGYDEYAIREFGKWKIYDCEKALEQWYIFDSTLKADNNITITSKSKQ